MRSTRLIGVLALVLIALGVLAPPANAGANVVTASDPAGDGKGPGDIRGLRLDQRASDRWIRVQIRTARPLNLASAPAWRSGDSKTFIRFNLDTTGGPGIDYYVKIFPDLSGASFDLFGVVVAPSPRIVCATMSQPQLTIIRVLVNPDCVDSPSSVRAFARYRLDRGGNGSVDSDDRAPNRRWSAALPVFL